MKNILIIRHAESAANAGERTDFHDQIPLTEKGKIQAKGLAQELNVIPDLIVISPYTRTHETALPFIAKHPLVIVETWDVQEFTYLDTKIYNGTTREERSGAIKKYFDALDIHYKDGESTETFYLFIKRIQEFIDKVKSRPEKNIVIFSHGAFIQNLKMYLDRFGSGGDNELKEDDVQELMELYKDTIAAKSSIENASVHKLNI